MLRFYPQETRLSCVPAYLRMVTAHWGYEIDEATLRLCCNTDSLGTLAKDAVACAQRLGFDAIELRAVTLEDLADWLSHDLYPILFLNLFPLDALWVSHAVVLEEITNSHAAYLDPAQGRRVAPSVTFEQAWQMGKNRVILVSPLGTRHLWSSL